jgi:hypothetical protein
MQLPSLDYPGFDDFSTNMDARCVDTAFQVGRSTCVLGSSDLTSIRATIDALVVYGRALA